MGESFLPSVVVSVSDDHENTFKGVLGLKNGFGRNEQDFYPIGTKGGFGITGVGNGENVGQSPSTPRIRMQSDGGLTIDSTSSASTSDDESDSDDLPSSDDDSGFGFAAVRGALSQVSSARDGASSLAKNVGPGVLAACNQDAAVPVTFTVPLTASLEIVWDAILCCKALIVPKLPTRGAAGSKESLIQLLEFAEDQLGCESVFICLPNGGFASENASGGGPNATATLVRMFSFMGFNTVDLKDEESVEALPSCFRSVPSLLEGIVVQYDIDDSEF